MSPRQSPETGSDKRRSQQASASLLARCAFLCGIALIIAAKAQEDGVLSEPDERVIGYSRSSDLRDPVAKLQASLRAGQATLKYDIDKGYLPALLSRLRVPVSSQSLVFSKTSSQAPHTSPKTPRAIYFNDTVYIGWVQGGESIDLIAVDPDKGPIFYTLDQQPSVKPTFVRRNDCMQCHIGPKTLNVPGLLVRSVQTAADGKGIGEVDGFVAGHNNSLSQRWAGWYVTGKHKVDTHAGNVTLRDDGLPGLDPKVASNMEDLGDLLDTSKYLTPHSDTVALLVLDHAVRMQNMITQATYETKFALRDKAESLKSGGKIRDWSDERIAKAGEALLAYMLFRDEAPLKGAVEGTSTFARDFSRAGPRDRKGRSLRELDLDRRLLRHPCSYLIYSASFDAMPAEMKAYIWNRLAQVLDGKDQSELYRAMDPGDRKAVLEILLDTKPEFRAAYKLRNAQRAASEPKA